MLATELHTEIIATVQHVEISKDGHLDLNASEHMEQSIEFKMPEEEVVVVEMDDSNLAMDNVFNIFDSTIIADN